MQNESMRAFVQRLIGLIMPQSVKPSVWGASQHGALCDRSGPTPRKMALILTLLLLKEENGKADPFSARRELEHLPEVYFF